MKRCNSARAAPVSFPTEPWCAEPCCVWTAPCTATWSGRFTSASPARLTTTPGRPPTRGPRARPMPPMQPRQKRNGDDAALQQVHRRLHQSRAQIELVERSSVDEGEVLGLVASVVGLWFMRPVSWTVSKRFPPLATLQLPSPLLEEP